MADAGEIGTERGSGEPSGRGHLPTLRGLRKRRDSGTYVGNSSGLATAQVPGTLHGAPAPTRGRVLRELLETERHYNACLQGVVEVYKRPLEALMGTAREILRAPEIQAMFGNVEQLLRISDELLDGLEYHVGGGVPAGVCVDVSHLFLRISPFFRLYTEFRGTIMAAQSIMAEKESHRGRKLAAFLEAASHLPSGKRVLQLPMLLIMPIQRLPRYQLLFQELLRHLPEGGKERAAVRQATDRVIEVCRAVNKDYDDKNLREVWEAQIAIGGGCPDLVLPYRKLLRRAPAQLLASRRREASAVTVYVFSDAVALSENGSFLGLHKAGLLWVVQWKVDPDRGDVSRSHVLVPVSVTEAKRCRACGEALEEPPFFHCHQCGMVVHESCARVLKSGPCDNTYAGRSFLLAHPSRTYHLQCATAADMEVLTGALRCAIEASCQANRYTREARRQALVRNDYAFLRKRLAFLPSRAEAEFGSREECYLGAVVMLTESTLDAKRTRVGGKDEGGELDTEFSESEVLFWRRKIQPPPWNPLAIGSDTDLDASLVDSTAMLSPNGDEELPPRSEEELVWFAKNRPIDDFLAADFSLSDVDLLGEGDVLVGDEEELVLDDACELEWQGSPSRRYRDRGEGERSELLASGPASGDTAVFEPEFMPYGDALSLLISNQTIAAADEGTELVVFDKTLAVVFQTASPCRVFTWMAIYVGGDDMFRTGVTSYDLEVLLERATCSSVCPLVPLGARGKLERGKRLKRGDLEVPHRVIVSLNPKPSRDDRKRVQAEKRVLLENVEAYRGRCFKDLELECTQPSETLKRLSEQSLLLNNALEFYVHDRLDESKLKDFLVTSVVKSQDFLAEIYMQLLSRLSVTKPNRKYHGKYFDLLRALVVIIGLPRKPAPRCAVLSLLRKVCTDDSCFTVILNALVHREKHIPRFVRIFMGDAEFQAVKKQTYTFRVTVYTADGRPHGFDVRSYHNVGHIHRALCAKLRLRRPDTFAIFIYNGDQRRPLRVDASVGEVVGEMEHLFAKSGECTTALDDGELSNLALASAKIRLMLHRRLFPLSVEQPLQFPSLEATLEYWESLERFLHHRILLSNSVCVRLLAYMRELHDRRKSPLPRLVSCMEASSVPLEVWELEIKRMQTELADVSDDDIVQLFVNDVRASPNWGTTLFRVTIEDHQPVLRDLAEETFIGVCRSHVSFYTLGQPSDLIVGFDLRNLQLSREGHTGVRLKVLERETITTVRMTLPNAEDLVDLFNEYYAAAKAR